MDPLSDTTPEAKAVQVELLRRAGPARRFALALSLTATVIGLARAGIRRARPDLGERGVLLEYAAIHYGADLAERLARRLPESPE